MSHFAVLVIGDAPEDQLAMYDENLELEMHLTLTKEEMIASQRNWIERYNKGWYSLFLKDPEAYKKAHADNEKHLHFIENEFPKMLEWTDEECYEEYVKDYRDFVDNGASWCKIDEHGNLWKTTNENAKWDWYQMGGRYRGLLKLREPDDDAPLYDGWQYDGNSSEYIRLKNEGYCDQAYAKDVVNLDKISVFAIVKDGEWYERGSMGWWAQVSNEKADEVWKDEVKELLKGISGETLLTVMDCHI